MFTLVSPFKNFPKKAFGKFWKHMTKQESILKKINEISSDIGRQVNIMEVCGTHTQVISRYGIRGILPKNIKLITGPGCPVCVTPQEDIDAIVNLALAGIPVATYGDVLRVPSFYGSLENAASQGAKVLPVYSIEEALYLKNKYPDLIFFGIGFETTAPMTAIAIKKGLTVYSAHKLFLPAMEALLQMGELKIDGFINPGHVSTIVGVEPYKKMKVPQVISGFEAEDVLVGIYMLLRQIKQHRAEVENEYVRSVKKRGNPVAYELIFQVFEIKDSNWRGFGVIPKSGLEIKKEHIQFNAKIKYKRILSKVDFTKSCKPAACRCGEVIRGLIDPVQCPLFGKACVPERPYGPCMVSVEGSCNVEYQYGDKNKIKK